MRNIARPLLRLLGRDDRGAVGVLVAVLVGGGVLLGMGALVIDVGQIYQNRAELQNGADAGSLAAARQCALGTCAPGTATSTALTYANANASALTGHSAGITAVCGSGGLGSCSSLVGTALTDCPPDPTTGVNFVDVLASTKLPSGSTLLPPVFGRTLVGNGTYDGTMVKACSQAEWGYAEQSDSLALTLSVCQWQDLTGSGGSGFNTLVPFFVKGKDKNCSDTAGQNVPGGFGWLSPQPGSACTAIIDLITSTVLSNPGSAPPAGCSAALAADVNDYIAGHPVTLFIPVFECPTGVTDCTGNGQGSGATYQIVGLAGFVITGYANVQPDKGSGAPKSLGTNSLCTAGKGSGSNQPCLEGYFTPGLDPVSDSITSTPSPFQVTGIKLSG